MAHQTPLKTPLKKKMGPHPLPQEIMQQRLQQPSQRRFTAMELLGCANKTQQPIS